MAESKPAVSPASATNNTATGSQKKDKLDGKAEQLREAYRQWKDQPWQIDFAEDVGVVFEAAGCAAEAVLEQVPQHNA